MGGRLSEYSISYSSFLPGKVDEAIPGALYPINGDPSVLAGVSLDGGSLLWNELPGVASLESVVAEDSNGGAWSHAFSLQDEQ
jgi:hypothetical protein